MAATIRRMGDLIRPPSHQPRRSREIRRPPAICLFARVSAASLQATAVDEPGDDSQTPDYAAQCGTVRLDARQCSSCALVTTRADRARYRHRAGGPMSRHSEHQAQQQSGRLHRQRPGTPVVLSRYAICERPLSFAADACSGRWLSLKCGVRREPRRTYPRWRVPVHARTVDG
jgi:hypothetical protein